MADHRTIGQILRHAREQAGLSQAALAARVGLAANHVVRLETGEKAQPRFETVVRLAAELGLSLDDVAAHMGLPSGRVSEKSGKAASKTAAALREFLVACRGVEKLAQDALEVIAAEAGIPLAAPPKRSAPKRSAPKRGRKRRRS